MRRASANRSENARAGTDRSSPPMPIPRTLPWAIRAQSRSSSSPAVPHWRAPSRIHATEGPPARSDATADSWIESIISPKGSPRRVKMTGEKKTSAATMPCRARDRHRSEVIAARSAGVRMAWVTRAKCRRNSGKLRWRKRAAGSEGRAGSRPGLCQKVRSRRSWTLPSRCRWISTRGSRAKREARLRLKEAPEEPEEPSRTGRHGPEAFLGSSLRANFAWLVLDRLRDGSVAESQASVCCDGTINRRFPGARRRLAASLQTPPGTPGHSPLPVQAQNPVDVRLRLRVVGNPPAVLHYAFPRVVRRQRKHQVAAEQIQEVAEVADSSLDVLGGIEDLLHAES